MDIKDKLIFAAGLFVGHILYWALVKRDWKSGIAIGTLTVLFYLPISYLFLYTE